MRHSLVRFVLALTTIEIRKMPGRKITLAILSLCVNMLVASLGGVAPASAAMPNCTVAAVAALNVPQMTLMSATEVPAALPNPEYCDVRGSVDTGGNAAGFRFQLPANWNRKLLF
jgi:hypothetical protein